MKTRIIHTKIWQDDYFCCLNDQEKLLFLYLLTNDRVNLSACYELSVRVASFDTGLEAALVERSLEKFHNNNKFLYYKNWIKIVNAEKYNNYVSSDKTKKAYHKEIQSIPQDVRGYFLIGDNDYQDIPKYVSTSQGYQHRLTAERYLGRKLEPDEVVHHLDKNPSNNKPGNLAVMHKDKHVAFHSGRIELADTNMILVSDYYDTNHKSESINNRTENINQKAETEDASTILVLQRHFGLVLSNRLRFLSPSR